MRLIKRRSFLKYLGLGGASIAVGAYAGSKMSGPGGDGISHPGGDGTSHPGGSSPALVSEAARFQHAQVLGTTGERGVFDGLFPGPTGQPGQTDAILYPTPAEPAKSGRVREYTLTATNKTIEIALDTTLEAWTFNGTVPGPIIRATEGDLLRVTLHNQTGHPHSIHFHGYHPANMDGVFEPVGPGESAVYEFTAEPFGVFPYHCHMEPLDQHIARGLYGAMIIDPPKPRPPAHEMVMVMNSYDLNQDGENEIYTVNGIGMYYVLHPIRLKVNQLVRIYLVNMTEFDPVNSLHTHATMFNVFRSGTSLEPDEFTDMVTLAQGERAILEFTYKWPGRYMFHAHQVEFSALGWMGLFDVEDPDDPAAFDFSAAPLPYNCNLKRS